MSDPLALVGTTIGDYQILRKKRSVDPYSLFFEAIQTQTRDTYWFAAYPPELLATEGIRDSIESELTEMQQVPHDFWVSPKEVMFDPDDGYLFLVYQPYPRSRTVSELAGKMRNTQARKVFYFLADLLQAAHDFGFSGNVDPRQIYVRRQNDDVELRWYHTPVRYHSLLTDDSSATDLNEWYSYLSPEQLIGREPTPHSDYFVLGTILFEVITGKRAFYHQQPDKARGLVLSATSKTIERARLNPEQRQLIESLHQIEPGDRLVGVREFQGKVRELFQDQNRFPRDFPNTSEHPALYVKESLPEAPALPSATPISEEIATKKEEVVTPEVEVESSDATKEQAVFEQSESDKEEPKAAESTIVKKVSKKTPSDSKKTKPSAAQDDAATSVVHTYQQMNLGRIHKLSLRVESSLQGPMEEVAQLNQSPYVRVVPVLPGCMVSPIEAIMDVRNPRVEAQFWVVPLAPVNKMDAAEVQLWHGGLPKDSIPIPCKVRSQTPTYIAGLASIFSFLVGFFFTVFGPKANVVTKTDSSLVSHVYQESITLFAQYGIYFGIFFLLTAGLSYYLLRPQPNPAIHYVLSSKLPSAASLSRPDND